MNDIDLLKAAAWAAGLTVEGNAFYGGEFSGLIVSSGGVETRRTWNPLENDGDAMWLANQLKISVWYDGESNTATVHREGRRPVAFDCTISDAAPIRRAVVLAAVGADDDR